MYELKSSELIRCRSNFDNALKTLGRTSIVVPQGRDNDDLYCYLVVTVKADLSRSEHVARSFGLGFP